MHDSAHGPQIPEQARSLHRRERLLASAARLLVEEGAAAVTHRRVAGLSDSSPGSVRYYFGTREDLLAQALAEHERLRSSTARDALERARRRPPQGPEEAARLLLEVYYGPALEDVRLSGILRFVAECGRESPRLAQVLAGQRRDALAQMDEALRLCGCDDLPPGLTAALLDGGVYTATVEARQGVAESALADVIAVLRLARAPGPAVGESV